MTEGSGYKPISAYGLIGNLRTAALVGRDGSIDWCCFPRLDSPSVFAALLDARRGGRFLVRLAGAGMGRQEYLGDTNVLRTVFRLGEAMVSVTDFMPLSGDINGCARARSALAPPEIVRLVECRGAAAEVEVEWSPRPDYARAAPRLEKTGEGAVALGGGARLALAGLGAGEIRDGRHGPSLHARLAMRPGERLALACRWDSREASMDPGAALRALEETLDAWRGWSTRENVIDCRAWAGDASSLVTRSALVFRLLAQAGTGAIAAAPTTSLPECMGGTRNWDYRYAWLRDSSLTAQAMVAMGHQAEALDLLYWMERVSEARRGQEWDLRIMYGLAGETDLEETVLDHLEGYRGSRPVRIGNGAARQFQLETYGELMGVGYELARRGLPLETHVALFLRDVADHVHDLWRKPDSGIWEMRCEPRHFVYSKAMAWMALDRAVLLAENHGLPGDPARWRRERDAIRRQVLERGYDKGLGAFVQSYGSRDLDAANLRLPMLEILPAQDPRVQSTIDRTMEGLMENGLVHRYKADDGLPGKEGAFGLCSFWLVDVLALSGRVREAREIFDGLAARANHLGLFPEQFDPRSGEFLGNFPQAFTHIGLINSALYLSHAEGRRPPEHAPVGTLAHRRSRRP